MVRLRYFALVLRAHCAADRVSPTASRCRAAYQQARLLGFFYLLTFSILKDKEPKFLTMEAPPPRLEELDADSVLA